MCYNNAILNSIEGDKKVKYSVRSSSGFRMDLLDIESVNVEPECVISGLADKSSSKLHKTNGFHVFALKKEESQDYMGETRIHLDTFNTMAEAEKYVELIQEEMDKHNKEQ